MRRAGVAWLTWAACGAALVVTTYFVMVRTGMGQHLDELATEGRKSTMLGLRRAAARIVQYAAPVVVIVVGAATASIAARRRGLWGALVVLGCVAGSVAVARLAKAELPHPMLLDSYWMSPTARYPSGHVAAIVTVGLLAVVNVPAAWRRVTVAVCLWVLPATAVAVAASGWHRPSDVLGGLGVGICFAALAAAVLGPTADTSSNERPLRMAAESSGDDDGRDDDARDHDAGDPGGQRSEGRVRWWSSWTGTTRTVMVVVAVSTAWCVVGLLVHSGSSGAAGASGFVAHTVTTVVVAALCAGAVLVQTRLVQGVSPGPGT